MAGLAAVRPLVTVSDRMGTVAVHVDIARTGREPLRVVASVGGYTAAIDLEQSSRSGVVRIVVDDPRLWWPHGHGEQPLYPVEVELRSAGDDDVLDRWQGRVGFPHGAPRHGSRRVRHPVHADRNDRPIFVRGANWIPDDAFPTRVDAARYAHRLEQGRDAGINLLRVWGGGIYESNTRSETVSGGSSPAWLARYSLTQFRRVCSLTPISRAVDGIAHDSSTTIRATCSLYSGLNDRRCFDIDNLSSKKEP